MSLDVVRNRALAALLAGCLVSSLGATAQTDKPDQKKADQTAQTSGQNQGTQGTDPLKRPLTDKQKKEAEKRIKQEVGETYKKWLDEDVRWIITDEEKSAFKQLSNDEERDNFIEAFWQRRDPTPDTEENEYKEEHYRRIAYANEHFSSGVPGWKTDRGRIYIMYGKPDSIDAHPSGGAYERPLEEGGGSTTTYPFETWRYRYLEGVGQEVEIEFVDVCGCNEYHMTIDRSEKDAMKYVPGGGMTLYEQMGLASQTDRFKGGLEQLGPGPLSQEQQSQQFDRLETYAKLQRAPQIKFKDLDEVVTHKIVLANLLPFDWRADFIKVTSDTVLVPITVQLKNKDVTWQQKDGVERMTVNISGRVTSLTGRIAQTFEDSVTDGVTDELLPKILDNSHVYWKALPLRPGRYKIDLAVKDANSDKVGYVTKGIVVPEYNEDKLSSSSLIVADQMEKVASRDVGGSGNFVIGTTKVRPRVDPSDGKPASFKRNQKANFWMQVYNLGIDEQTKKSSATIEYDVVNVASNKPIIHAVENTKDMGNVGEQVTLEKSLSLGSLEPGTYRITIKVNDNVSKQTITPSARFAVE